jgi:dihydroorotate dehydrogenase
MGVDLDAMAMLPNTGGMGTHGGYCGPGAKPIALHMVAEIARDPETAGLPISGIGGMSNWTRRGGVHRAGQRLGAGVHGRHAVRLQDRARR